MRSTARSIDELMDIEQRQQDGVTIFEVWGVMDIYNMPALRDILQDCLETSDNHVVINMENVETIYSSGVGALISFSQQLGKKDRRLALACLSPATRHVLTLTKLISFFAVYDSEEEAVMSVQG